MSVKMNQGTWDPGNFGDVIKSIEDASVKSVELMEKLVMMVHEGHEALPNNREKVVVQFAWILAMGAWANCHARFQNPYVAQILAMKGGELADGLYDYLIKNGAMSFKEMAEAQKPKEKS